MSRVSRRQQKSRNADPARALEQAQAAMASRDWDGAKKAYRKLLRLRPDLAEAWSDLGTIHLLMGEAGPAEDALERARRLDPLSVVTLSNLANLKKQSGEPDAAEKLYRRILEIVPERANAWHELARVKNFAVGDADIAAMDRLLGAGELDDEGRMHVSFALGKAREDVGNYDAAFRHLAEANRIKHDSLGYDIRHHEKIVQELIRTFEPGFMMAHSSVGCDDETSVFVLGMPRSGTTLVEQILASHSAVHGGGERTDLEMAVVAKAPGFPSGLEALPADAFREIGADYVRRLRRAAPKTARITDKLPQNFLLIGMIAIALPKARIVHCRRSPLDTCLSCFGLHFPYGQSFSYDLGDIGAYYRLYRRLMDHWYSVLPGRILDIDYEAIVADPAQQARRLIDHCGLAWEDGCLNFHRAKRLVSTASASQVREPIYNRSVARWRRFADHLAPLLEALGPYADEPADN